MSTEQSSSNISFVRPLAVSETPVRDLVASEHPKAEKLVDQPKPESPIDLHEAKWGRPYIVDLFDMTGVEREYTDEVKSIDQFVLSEIETRKLNPTKESYQSIVAQIEAKLGIDPNTRYDERVSKVKAYVEVVMKQKELELTKKQLENAS